MRLADSLHRLHLTRKKPYLGSIATTPLVHATADTRVDGFRTSATLHQSWSPQWRLHIRHNRQSLSVHLLSASRGGQGLSKLTMV